MDDIEIIDRIASFSEKIIEGVSKKINDAKLTCKACVMFNEKDNVEAFFNVTGDYKKIIRKEAHYHWIIGLLSTALVTTGLKLFKIF